MKYFMRTNNKKLKKFLENQGVEYIGIEKNPKSTDFVLFNDPKTGTTLTLSMELATPENIYKKILAKAEEYRKVTLGKLCNDRSSNHAKGCKKMREER